MPYTNAPNNTTHPRTRLARGFSLVELLVVIAIIALLAGLLLPALAGARRAGLKSSTQNMLNAFTNAVSSFSNDNGSRMPGYFSQAQMGAQTNLGQGMSAMENVMLELGGTDVIVGSYQDFSSDINEEGGIIAIAPFEHTSGPSVIANTKLIGASGAYFAPDAQFLKVMEVDEGQQVTVTDNGQHLMPDVVDAFGNPILAWVKDENARGSIDPNAGNDDAVYAQFAQATSDDGAAWYYLASNDCFYGSDAFLIGEGGVNQQGLSGLGTDIDDVDRIKTLATLLASPSYYGLEQGETLDSAARHDIFPIRPRGSMLAQSAGADGIYLGTSSTAWKSNVDEDGPHLVFGGNFKSENDRYRDDDGSFITIDIISEFDDIIQSVN